MEIIAHRGASYDAPENTLAAVNLAWEQGADAVEVDVHLSRDHHIMVIHDDNTRKTAGLRRRVADQTLAELKALDAGSWKGKQWRGERIPLLTEVLEALPDGKRLFIEVKCGAGFVKAFENIRGSWEAKSKRLVLIGFSLETMQAAKERFPEVEVCWIVEFKRSLKSGRWTPRQDDILKRASDTRMDGLDTGAKGPLTLDWLAQTKKADLSYYVWTVDKPERARELFQIGVNGVTTNRPGWLRDQLRLTAKV
jgi:glycerophosphoryl diester phosphodiesterase